MYKGWVLPRQARDKHRENPKRTPVNYVAGYFHAHYESNELLHFPWDAAPILPREGLQGPGHLLGTQMVFTTNDSSKFAGNFNHVCEGNYEIFFDNATRAFGNDSSVDWVR